MKINLLLSLILFTFKIAFCQPDTLFSEQKKDLYLFKYIEKTSEKDKTTNYFIEELSKNISNKTDYSGKYFFIYNYTLLLTKSDVSDKSAKNKDNYFILFEIKDGKCSSDYFYKNINIADILLPDFMDFIISIKNSDDALLKQFPVSKMQIYKGTGKTDSLYFQHSRKKTKLKLVIDNKKFYYNDSSKVTFQKKIQLINDYYNSEPLFTSAFEKLKSINTENVDMVKVYSFKLNEVEKLIEELLNKNFQQNLNLSINDPFDFTGKMKDLIQKTQKLRLIIDQTIASLDYIYCKKGIEKYAKGDSASAFKLFKKSVAANPTYAPAYYYLAKKYLENNELDKSSVNINKILTELNTDKQMQKQAVQLGNKIYTSYIELSEEFIAAEKYNEALDILKKVKQFCDSTPLIKCDQSLQKNISNTKYGIYKSFITVSEKALQKNILEIAEIYILKAKDYQKENSADIIYSYEADPLLNHLLTKYCSRAEHLNSINKFDSSLVILEKLKDICKKYPKADCGNKLTSAIICAKKGIYKSLLQKTKQYIKYNEPDIAELYINKAKAYQKSNSYEIPTSSSADSLMLIVKKQSYNKYISTGITHLLYNDGEKAMQNFEAAKTLEKTYYFKKNPSLDSLINASVKPSILNYINKGCVKVWGNELEKALQIQDSVKILIKKYSLNEDTAINKAMISFKKKIFNQQCKNAQELYYEYYRKAFQNIDFKKYSKADDLFLKCNEILANNCNCKIKDTLAKKGKEKYLNAAIYQKKIEKSENLANSAKYYDAIDNYKEGENFYYKNNIQQFGITHVILKDYLTSQKDNKYIHNCADYYLDGNDYVNTLYFMEILRKRNYSEKKTESLQKKFAEKLAANDFKAKSKQKTKKNIEKITQGNSWYIYFENEYIKIWKELNNNK